MVSMDRLYCFPGIRFIFATIIIEFALWKEFRNTHVQPTKARQLCDAWSSVFLYNAKSNTRCISLIEEQ